MKAHISGTIAFGDDGHEKSKGGEGTEAEGGEYQAEAILVYVPVYRTSLTPARPQQLQPQTSRQHLTLH